MTTKKQNHDLRAKADAACTAWRIVRDNPPAPKASPRGPHDGVTLEQRLAEVLDQIAMREHEDKLTALHAVALEAVEAVETGDDGLHAFAACAALEARLREEADIVEKLRLFRQEHDAAVDEIKRGEADRIAQRVEAGWPLPQRLAWAETTWQGPPGLQEHIASIRAAAGPQTVKVTNNAGVVAALREQEIDVRAQIERMHNASGDAERYFVRNRYEKLSTARSPSEQDRRLADDHRTRMGW